MKRITLLLLCLPSLLFAQVGINTANPDPSSMLDVTAPDKGVVFPRMDSATMEGIPNPVAGLMVFNTDANDYMVFNGTVWIEIGESTERVNYKLIQSTADLEAEDQGNEYLLDENTLYEINGTVVIDKPLDLNNAYIEGIDSGNDILVNASSAALFTGDAGGRIRSLTISGGSQPIFDLTGAGSNQNLIVNNTIFVGGSSVGSVESMDLVFFNTIQFVSSGDGLTTIDNNAFFINNVFWTDSCTGTFLEIDGTYENLQIANGRIEVDSGEIGIDVSSNPTITNTAALMGLSFVGDGDLVNAYTTGSYTGFNFNNRWDVNCQGIPLETDNNASANFYNNNSLTTGFVQSITSGTAVEVQGNGGFTATNLFRFSAPSGTPNELTYEGRQARTVQINTSLSIRVTGGIGDFYAFSIAVNDVVQVETNSVVRIASDAEIQNVSLNGAVELQPGDTIKVFVQRLTDGTPGTVDNLVVFSENLSVR